MAIEISRKQDTSVSLPKAPIVQRPRALKGLATRDVPIYPQEVVTRWGGMTFISERGVNLPPSEDSYVLARRATEVLIDMLPAHATIVDVGTGTGVMAITAANKLASAQQTNITIVATDISHQALERARKNAQINSVNTVRFLQTDGMEDVRSYYGKADLILTNPPFYDTEGIPEAVHTPGFIPLIAVDGGHDSLDLYRKFFAQAHETLSDSGGMVVQVQSYKLHRIAVEAARALPGRSMIALRDEKKRNITTLVIGSIDMVDAFIRRFPDHCVHVEF